MIECFKICAVVCLLIAEIYCQTPTTYYADLDQSIVMTCQVTVNPSKKPTACSWSIGLTSFYDSGEPVAGYEFKDAKPEEGKCNFEIKNVKKEDNGEWKCSFIPTGQNVPVKLAVTKTRDEPSLKIGDDKVEGDEKNKVSFAEGETNKKKDITCISTGRMFEPEIKMTVNGNEVTSTRPIPSNPPATDGTISFSSTIQVEFPDIPSNQQGRAMSLPTSIDNNMYERKVKCTVKYSTKEPFQSVEKVFGEMYKATQVKLVYSGTTTNIEKTKTLVCNADGIPTPTIFNIEKKDKNEWKVFVAQKEKTITEAEAGTYRCTHNNGDKVLQSNEVTFRIGVDPNPGTGTTPTPTPSRAVNSFQVSLFLIFTMMLCFVFSL